MSPEMLEALKKSIKKWEAIVAGTGIDKLARNCALCQLCKDGEVQCVSPEYEPCPVYNETGYINCQDSPWQEWASYMSEMVGDDDWKVFDADSLKIAKAEVEFLKSLLPEEES